jgi:hypothetical protein
MRAIYRTSFQVVSDEPVVQLATKVANCCWSWVSIITKDAALVKNGLNPLPLHTISAHTSVEAMYVLLDGVWGWGLRFSHDDHSDEAIRWSTELTLFQPDSEKLHFGCSLSVGRKDGSYAPFKRFASRPRIVLEVVEKFKCLAPFRLLAKPLPLIAENNGVEDYFRLLSESRRRHPVIYISCDKTGRLVIDPKKAASHLAGLAYVVYPAGVSISNAIAAKLPQPYAAYCGAIRLYWPRFSPTDNPFRHPLWTIGRVMKLQQWDDNAVGKRLLEEISTVAVSNVHRDFLTWERLEEIARRKAIGEARNAKDEHELLLLYTQENEDLQARLRAREQDLEQKARDLYQAQTQIERLKSAILDAKTPSSDAPVDQALIECASDAMNEAFERFKDRITYAPNSKSEGQESPFQPAFEVYQAFEWLATVYFDSKTGKKSCSDFERSISERIPGWHYSGHQKEATMKANAEWYQCNWQGKKIWIEEHLKCGRSTDAKETIRIAVTWEPTHKKVVVGFMGQHQRSTQS